MGRKRNVPFLGPRSILDMRQADNPAASPSTDQPKQLTKKCRDTIPCIGWNPRHERGRHVCAKRTTHRGKHRCPCGRAWLVKPFSKFRAALKEAMRAERESSTPGAEAVTPETPTPPPSAATEALPPSPPAEGPPRST